MPAPLANNRQAQTIEALMAEHGDGILRLCYLYLKDVQLAEDAFQETFLRAYQALPQFKGTSSVKTWLYAIAANVCRSEYRKKKPLAFSDCTLPEAGYEPAMGEDDTVVRAVLALDEKYREVILLFYYSDMSVKDIACALHVSSSTVTVRLSRAREKLKKDLKEWYFDEPIETGCG